MKKYFQLELCVAHLYIRIHTFIIIYVYYEHVHFVPVMQEALQSLHYYSATPWFYMGNWTV